MPRKKTAPRKIRDLDDIRVSLQRLERQVDIPAGKKEIRRAINSLKYAETCNAKKFYEGMLQATYYMGIEVGSYAPNEYDLTRFDRALDYIELANKMFIKKCKCGK